MDLQRICVKLFADEDGAPSAEEVFRIFSSWIHDTPDEVLIDVADYRHVNEGPLVVLVGHEADRTYDNSAGRIGLLYSRKRPRPGDGASPLAEALRAALATCKRLEDAAPGARFRTDELQLTANDRLRAPNEDATLEALRPGVDEVFGRLFGGGPFTCERQGDSRQRFAVQVRGPAVDNVSTLIQRLGQ